MSEGVDGVLVCVQARVLVIRLLQICAMNGQDELDGGMGKEGKKRLLSLPWVFVVRLTR